MSEKEKKVEVTGTEGTADAGQEIVIEESKAHKIIKWVLKGVALGVTFVAGIVLGRVTGNHDDDSEESADNTEEAA